MKKIYNLNKEAKVGDEIKCPSCKAKFIKKSYQQVFCKTKKGSKCKDKYWNTVTPTKRNNTTRISPANAAWVERQRELGYSRNVYGEFHPFEGLNDDEYKSF